MPGQRKYVIGVTAACMLTKKTIYNSVNGFDEVRFPIAFNDVDYCLKLNEKRYRLIQDSSVINYHHESVSRSTDGSKRNEAKSFKKLMTKWKASINFSEVRNQFD